MYSWQAQGILAVQVAQCQPIPLPRLAWQSFDELQFIHPCTDSDRGIFCYTVPVDRHRDLTQQGLHVSLCRCSSGFSDQITNSQQSDASLDAIYGSPSQASHRIQSEIRLARNRAFHGPNWDANFSKWRTCLNASKRQWYVLHLPLRTQEPNAQQNG